MDPFLLFMAAAAVVLIVAFIVGIRLPSVARGWRLVGREKKEADTAEPQTVEAAESHPRPARPPGSVAWADLAEGDIVHVVTETASHYRFTLLKRGERRYRISGKSVSAGKNFDMEVCIPGDFVPGRRLKFWHLDRSHFGRISAIVRVLVEKHEEIAVSA